MKRRGLMAVAVTASIPSWAWAQSAVPRRLGYIGLGRAGSDGTTKAGLQKGLADLGYVEGTNLLIDYRYADGDERRLTAQMAELVVSKPALLVVPGVVATRTAVMATLIARADEVIE